MTAKNELKKIFPGLIVAALAFFLADSWRRWVYALIGFFALYGILTIWQYRHQIGRWLKRNLYSILRKPLLQTEPGFCGREDVIKEVYDQYCATKEINVVLICGLGGSGKTTIFNFFNKVLINAPKTIIFANHSVAKTVHNSSIVFADYAYENLGAIRDFIHDLKENRKKKILIVLLERTYAKEYLSVIKYNHIIDLNRPKYILEKEALASIISYNVSNLFDTQTNQYIATSEKIDWKHSLQFANQLTTNIDPQYHRPIFAVLIAELYRDDKNLNLNETNSMNSLIEKYWKKKTRYSTMQGLIKATDSEFRAEKAQITEAINNAKQLVELLTLFCAMSRLKIEFKSRDTVTIYSNNQIVNDEKLTSYINQYFSRMIDDNVKKHLVIKILGIDVSTSYEDLEYPHFVIEPNRFDIVSTWLLNKFYNETGANILELSSIISSVSDRNVEKSILSFVLRAIDEDNSDILIWYTNLKDCFISYDFSDFNEIIRELLVKLNLACNNSQNRIKETISGFLLSFIDTIYEHIANKEEIKLLQYQLEVEKNNARYSDEVKTVLANLVEKTKQLLNEREGELTV